MKANRFTAKHEKYRAEHDASLIQFRVYDVDGDPDGYISNCIIDQYCIKGVVKGMNGPHLLATLLDYMDELRDVYGILTLEGFVLLKVRRACSILTKRQKRSYSEHETCTWKGRDMIWIKVGARI